MQLHEEKTMIKRSVIHVYTKGNYVDPQTYENTLTLALHINQRTFSFCYFDMATLQFTLG